MKTILNKRFHNEQLYCYIGISFFALLVILFCSKASPLYAVNDWPDANAYFTVGKGMMNGRVPYRDLFDHKGPLLYLLYGLGYLLDHTGFTGVFIVQILFMSGTLILIYSTAHIYLKNKTAAFLVALLMPFLIFSKKVYAARLDFGGVGPEEFILFFAAVSVYLCFRQCAEREGKKVFRPMLFHGVSTACVSMLKFNYIVFFAGLLIPMFLYRLYKKEFKAFLMEALLFLSGFVAAWIPYLIYALTTKSFHDFINVYIKFNALYGMKSQPGIAALTGTIKKVVNYYKNNLPYACFLGFGLVNLFVSRKAWLSWPYKIMIFSGFLCLNLIVFFGPFYEYCLIPSVLCGVFGFTAFFDLLKFIRKHISVPINIPILVKRISISAVTVLILGATVVNSNLMTSKLMVLHRESVVPVQTTVAEIIHADLPENRTLLDMLSLDLGFYTASGIVPKDYYFYVPNISYEVYPYVLDSQLESIRACKNKYIIFPHSGNALKYTGYNTDSPIYDRLYQSALENYDYVGIYPGTGVYSEWYFHLLRLRD